MPALLFRLSLRSAACVAALALPPAPALAQRTGENAVTSAEDAFGTVVGRESIGIYSEYGVRGFSPAVAGNIRLEGLYIDAQGAITSRISDGETVRVGPAAQGYAFPAPTGIADLTLRPGGTRFVASPFVSIDGLGSRGIELDVQLPVSASLGVAAGAGLVRDAFQGGVSDRRWNVGLVPRWHVSDTVELTAFYTREQTGDQRAQPIYIPLGDVPVGRVERQRYLGPGFAAADFATEAYGLLGRAALGAWTVRAGAFRTSATAGESYANLVLVDPDTVTTNREVDVSPPSRSDSWSGEARVSRLFADGPRQHLVTIAMRGRDNVSVYGDSVSVDLGTAGLRDVIAAAKPALAFGASTRDVTRQATAGLSYGLNWTGVGQTTIGMQRTAYTKDVTLPDVGRIRGTDYRWLPSISTAVPVARGLSAYASYVRGLEDSGVAPSYAANANQLLPAIPTEQADAGLKLTLPLRTSVILGYYRIAKPYIALDAADIYRVLGAETHSGIEASVTTSPRQGLRVVFGGFFSRPRVEADATTAQAIGTRPVNQPARSLRLSANYTLPFARKVSVDGSIGNDSAVAANVANTVSVPGQTVLRLGARYQFALAGKPVTLRITGSNLTNVYRLRPVGSNVYSPNMQRNVGLYLTTDL
ncbi:TonB-dependent receptor [Sphingomonas sp. A2-49]|uniref:TonB-dependent receptor domain-containing protein n=1 Tax=Sphingomonas sp. A2-49 TaxID=1391375 RepID=UPI0021D34571|nr:TonB-dependent receptor [Sphingomonas sp. A2-49]MCU6453905.1 TonB-dependent receptor [Sphingomonas sp. A2-49]